MRMIASPDAASSPMMRWTSTLAPMSMPRVGSSRIRTRGLVASHLASTTFCWLPPESAPTGWSTPVILTSELCGVLVGDRAFDRRALTSSRGNSRGRIGRRHVLGDREVEHQALLVAVLGQVGDAGIHRRRRAREGDRRAVQADLAARRARSMPNRTRATSVRPAPTRPARPRISPARTREADVAEGPDPGQALDLEDDLADRGLDLREERHGPPDHVPDEVGGGQLGASRS